MLRVGLAIFVVALLCAGILFLIAPAPATPPVQTPPANTAANLGTNNTKTGGTPAVPAAAVTEPKNLYIGQIDAANPAVHTVLTTRKSERVYQALVRYNPRQVSVAEVPGLSDLQQIMQLPQHVMRLDQDTEMLVDNLGEPSRSITSSHLYLDPATAHVVAYDIANTSGGQPQRFIGHRTKSGITVEVLRGGEQVDRHEIPFASRDTFIPVEMEFIHQWYVNNEEARNANRPVTFSIFIPEVMTILYLVAKPLGTQVIPVKDTTYECARYDVTTVSTQSVEVLRGRQEMWFDKRTGLLMKREDFEASLGPGDAPVTERGTLENLAQVAELRVQPPVLPEKPFPYPLDKDLVYSVRVRDGELGRLRFSYSKNSDPAKAKGAYVATASVSIETKGSSRHEAAVTRFDEKWLPLSYEAIGDEFGEGDAKAAYKISAALGGGNIEVRMNRDVETAGTNTAAAPVLVKSVSPGVKDDGEWQDPLVRVPISDEELKAQQSEALKQRATSHTMKRKLSTGTYLFDFNRVEHLAAIASRLPLPDMSKTDDAEKTVFQKVALLSVRQNRCGVIMFEIKPEPRPALTERQKQRLQARDRDEPQLFVANCASAILPCRMLLKGDGTLLELTLKLGNNEVTYTLDDPIMRRRAERAKKQKLQEGPQLIRPPWW
ncbi:MAG TPA: hypothetical protein VEK08_00495 [Planctomycetota bacterium]|nr:hypothetical protein [Planctomycetota bacterium]